jgi:hypothetical protein
VGGFNAEEALVEPAVAAKLPTPFVEVLVG